MLQPCSLFLSIIELVLFCFRAIVWVQTQRDKQMEQIKGSTPRKDDSTHDFRIGRLKQEKVSIPRGENVIVLSEPFIFFIFTISIIF